MENGGYPGADLKPRQKFKIYNFLDVVFLFKKICLRFKSAPGSPISHYYQYKTPISIDNVDISKIIVSNSISLDNKGFKYSTGYEDGKKS